MKTLISKLFELLFSRKVGTKIDEQKIIVVVININGDK